ncbi:MULTISPECIES: S8 family serine peptidase [unclassified Acidiphilium]|uniref:S8 family serine peptidase n=1 Tax=unclassified Acidiphilium TaxID=2617493 RepID=UPI000BD38989|nr:MULTISPECIES: S8 family serine peptidase [unclassified Acidiphilium]OYV56892.1 MAG: autotransporter domain-containing protein [Acidiphilium sp. 20-67-58]HQT60912.1 S8 family serine peptidase [Acidiphilium sp.]
MILSRRSLLLAATALSLTACSGGGGGSSSISGQPTPPPPPPSNNAAGAGAGASATATNIGGISVYLGPQSTNVYPTFNQYTPTNVLPVLQAGITGAGVAIGVLDSGVNTSVSSLSGRIAWFNSYTALGNATVSANNLASANDPFGHGTVVTALLAGYQQGTYGNNSGPTNFFPGGVAPGATVYAAQICDSTGACQLYTKPYQDLQAQGVHLFNNSVGENASDYSSAAAAQSASQAVGTLFSALPANNLYVWAAGNNPANPGDISVEAEVPVYTPSLQPQWLVAVNVDIGTDGKVSGLDPSSDACGVTAQWCVSAPGYVQIPIVAGTSFVTGYGVGTSFATPIVTGTAALVWQKFPWFTPANVTDTILTTATHLGAGTGPNSTYGWGLINAAAAVNGPAAFAFGTFAADIGVAQSTFANPIAGSGGLALSGTTGTLTLAAANTYTGGTTVSSGNLNLTGSLASGVTVTGGTFGGSGTVTGDVVASNGTIISQGSVGSAPGLTINGNYTAQSGANTAIAIGTPLTVTGTAKLAGNAQVLAPPASYTPQATEIFIRAGTIAGTFTAQTYGAGVFYTVGQFAYGPTTVTATVAASNVAQVASVMPGATTASVAGGAAIQSGLEYATSTSTAGSARSAEFIRTAGQILAATTTQQAQASLTSVSGEAYPTMRTVGASAELSLLDTTAQHIALSGTPGKTTTWLQYVGDFGRFGTKGSDGVRFSSNGFTAGLDTPVEGALSLGGAISHISYSGSLSGVGGRGNDDVNTADLYARYGGDTGPYAAAQLAYSWIDGRVHRSIYTASSTLGVAGTISDNMIAAAGEVGYNVDGLDPFLSITDIRYDSGATSETGGNGFGLLIRGQSANYAFATAGLRANDDIIAMGRVIALHATLAWRHTIDNARFMTASFTGTPGAAFRSYGQDMPANEGIVGLSLAGDLAGAWRWQAGWTATIDGLGLASNALDAGVKVRF